MSRFVCLLVLLLIVLHQDNWFWADGRLVFGFFPIGLFYHACISLVAGLVWWLAVRYCWPRGLEGPVASGSQTTDGPA